jgi:NADH-quinone oxidoreductase subunit G
MGSVGACRQCAVKQFKDENDNKGKIVMSCLTPAEDGTRISIDDPEVRRFRAAVIEWLMLNHPHDCPVCDEGGECHLQDMTVMTGHNYRRNRFPKRTHRNQNLGPFLNHEMNRCIQCYRCLRFYRNIAGGRDLNVFGCHHHVYFGRHRDGILENEFSGNLAEICPTGVFTDKSLKRHYTRKWDLQTAPSVCVHCSLGCNTLPGERYGSLRRIRNRFHADINNYFLCDRGRYGYEFVNSDKRIDTPGQRLKKDDPWRPVTTDTALAAVRALIRKDRPLVGIGSSRATLESNYMLRNLVGPDNFFFGVTDNEWKITRLAADILQQGPAPPVSMKQAAEADAVFILGENVVDTAPILALNLRLYQHIKTARISFNTSIPEWDDAGIRELIQRRKEILFIAGAHPTRLDEAAKAVCRSDPDNLARLGFHIASLIDKDYPRKTDLPAELRDTAGVIAEVLKQAEHPVIVSGTGSNHSGILEATADVAGALQTAGRTPGLLLTFAEVNSFGLMLLEPAGGLDSAREALENGPADTLVILENDIFRSLPGDRAEALLKAARHVICLDYLRHETAERADIVLPAATFAEATGTVVNNEGRAQRSFQVFRPAGNIRPAWRWLRDVTPGDEHFNPVNLHTIDDVIDRISRTIPRLEGIRQAAPDAIYRKEGLPISRQSFRYSGRTAMHADISVHEFTPEKDRDAPLAFSMEGRDGPAVPPSLAPRFWAPGWNSVQSLNKFQPEPAAPPGGGTAGKRLIRPVNGSTFQYFASPPTLRPLTEKERYVVPIHHVFGSEELSVHSPGIAEQSPRPYVALGLRDAEELGLVEGETAAVEINGTMRHFPVRVIPGMAANTVGLPMGLPDMSPAIFAGVCRIGKKGETNA